MGPTRSEAGTGGQQPVTRGLCSRRTNLEKALLGVCGVALVACAALVGVVAFSSSPSSPSISFSAPAEELMPRAQPLVAVQKSKKDAPTPVQDVTQPVTSSRLRVLKANTASGKQVEVCDTQECTLAAAQIIEAMDSTVSPCDNFYKFACGGWMQNNPVPDDSSRWAQFDVLARELSNALGTILTEPISAEDPQPIAKAKTMYLGCMDEAKLEEVGLAPLTDFLSQFGGWPMTNSEWDETLFNWQTTVAQGTIKAGMTYLVNPMVYADEKNTFTTAIYIDQTTLGMGRSVLVQPDEYETFIAAYKTYIASTANILAASLGQSGSQVDADVEELLAFEKTLAEITTPDEERRDSDRMYNPMTVTQLNTLSGTDWLPVLAPMFASAGITVDGDTVVIVKETQYMSNLTQLIQTTSPRTLSNYLMWRYVMSLGDSTTQAMRDASFQFRMVVAGVTAEKPRSITCADMTNNYLGIAVGTKYVQTYFPQQAKEEVNEMVEDIRSSFKNLLEVNEWMDDDTKPKAVEKANAITKFIGYPDWYTNETALDAYFAELGDLDKETHFANLLTVLSWTTMDNLREFGQPSKRDRWFMPPTIVNAYYMPEYNSITFPAGILQPPFYRSNTLMALNYGGIGQVIGHEITHGFDDQGRQYDKDGNTLPWWTNATLGAFQSHAQCIVDQYDAIRLPELEELMPNATLNGINTQGENIADNGGLREALLAYQLYVDRNGEEPRLPGLTEYTPMQLLFLSNANIWCASITNEGLLNQVLTDPHSPAEFRVQVPMSNMKEFSDIWGCAADDPMNPTDKCVVW